MCSIKKKDLNFDDIKSSRIWSISEITKTAQLTESYIEQSK